MSQDFDKKSQVEGTRAELSLARIQSALCQPFENQQELLEVLEDQMDILKKEINENKACDELIFS